ncbi:unnamed protein product [Mytilus edulis]|uniref:Uncharacterized protein n=1 Tax=Mytilus edulis TaxID=6550 RepID=A0A8S3RLM6_MYTED|nr:unnamed protein product [Mytilus edulis]
MQVTEVRQREVEASKSSQQKQHPYRYKKKKPGVKVSYIDKSDERKHKRTALAAAKSRAGSKLKQIALKLEKEQIFDPNKANNASYKKDKVASFLTPGKGAYSFAQGSGQSISEAQRKQLENIHIAVNEDDISIEQPNEVTKRRGELKRLFSERSKTRGSRGRGCGRGRGGRRGGKSDNVKRKSSKVLLENNNNMEMSSSEDNAMSPVYLLEDDVGSVKLRPKRKTAKVLVYEDDNDMEVPDSREMSPVIVLEDVVLNSSLLREASVLIENMDFSVDPTAKEPTETPEQPEETQEQPKETQEQPEETQEPPKETQEPPEETQEPPEETQEPPKETQEPPEETQEPPEETQEPPEETQEPPEETQEPPKETQESPEETQEPPKETQEPPEETQEPPEETQEPPEETQEPPKETQEPPEETQEPPKETQEPPEETQEPPEDILSKDDFVLVELPIEKTSRTKQFIGKIISVSEHDIDVSFMKKNKTGKFIWPEVMDQSMVERRSVKRKLKPPAQIAKRRSIEMFFSDMS